MQILVAFLASVIGAICGIGGGVIIKPVLDAISGEGPSVINFLSGCTVLAMSTYSILKEIVAKKKFQFQVLISLSLGAVFGGILGNSLFQMIKQSVPNTNIVSGIQAICLFIVVALSFIYTIYKEKIKTLHVQNPIGIVCIGLALGTMSSFLGIGGGPINLVVLYYFFSYSTKEAAIASIFVILCGQVANLAMTVMNHQVPPVDGMTLVLMMLGGVAGGIVGRKINSKIDNKMVERLFMAFMIVILLICVLNIKKYLL